MRLKNIVLTGFAAIMALMQSCTSSGYAGANGGEVTGSSQSALREPVPYGMVLVKRGSLKMGAEGNDSLWGSQAPAKEISVESFWMDLCFHRQLLIFLKPMRLQFQKVYQHHRHKQLLRLHLQR